MSGAARSGSPPDLAGQVAIVTGGNRGIGLAVAHALAARGAALCLAGRDEAALERAAGELSGTPTRAVATDVGREADVARLVAEAEALGPVGVVVNNAAVAGPTAPVHEIPHEAFADVLAVNLLGPYLVARHALPAMIARGAGAIVNVGSIAGVEAYPLRAPYCASKWGLVGLTRTLAAEVGPHGIRVNLVAPGPTRGERSASVIAGRAAALGRPVEELTEEYAAQIPLRRFVEPAEVAATVAFLASSAASGITGQAFCVSGGIEI
jgi:NAD(P)-dependent dehydrogenase (short-subunit alcohol dehydrogenase family)